MLPIDRETHERGVAASSAANRARAEVGLAAFEEMEMPSERDEDWRYVDPGIDLADHGITESPGAASGSVLEPLLSPVATAYNVDGHTTEISSGGGATLERLEEASDLGDGPPLADRYMALHEAFVTGGVVVGVPRGVAVEGPVVVDMEVATEAALSVPRVRIVAGESSQVSVVVHQRSKDGLGALVVPRFEVVAGNAARVDLTVVQQWGDDTAAVANHHHRAGRDATVRLAEAGLGGRYSRLHLQVDLEGDGSAAQVIGAYFGEDDQTLDYRYFMRHAARGTTSEMFLKGAVADEARSVFTGMIRIEPEGQKTSAHQTNRNLVLSDGAEAHSVPNLEILADDVRCGHGSTVGPLDEEQRYYLMSRGLDRRHADRLQVKGFFEEALLRFFDQRLEPMLRSAAMAKYEAVVS